MRAPSFASSFRSIVLRLLSVAAIGAVCGCASLDSTGRRLGASVGSGVVSGATKSFKSQLTPALNRGVEGALRGARFQLDTASALLVERGNQAIGGYGAQLEQTVRGPLSDALQELVRANVRAAGEQGRAQATLLTGQLSADLGALTPRLDSAVTHAAANATAAVTKQLAQDLRGELRTSLVAAAGDIADKAAARAVRSVDQGARRSPLVKWGIGIGVALAVAALGAVAVRVYRELRHRQAALDAVAQVIRESQDPRLKEAVKERATQMNVEPWLNSYLKQRGYLSKMGQKIPAPPLFDGGAEAESDKAPVA